jgi:hypothetical protein
MFEGLPSLHPYEAHVLCAITDAISSYWWPQLSRPTRLDVFIFFLFKLLSLLIFLLYLIIHFIQKN